jgi:HSP20 family molecular chaperone IbpA
MFKKSIILSTILASFLATSVSAYVMNLNDELQRNTKLIEQYKNGIKNLEARNAYLLEQKEKNPKLYEKKPYYEETNKSYIYRVKLNGASAKNVSFTIKDHVLSIEMNMKMEEKNETSYYASSRYFYQSYSIPKNVEEDKIKHSVDGDYFVITMPKK